MTSPFLPMFETFRRELDEHHDRREKIIKASRDITAQSKKIIFSLQRVRDIPSTPLPPPIQKDIAPRHATIQALFASLLPSLPSLSAWRYQRNLSPGIQEYLEACSFAHYLATQTLLSPSEAQALLPAGILLTEDDYLLAIFDLSGELMRFGITGIGVGGKVPGSREGRDVAGDLRELRVRLEALDFGGGGGWVAREAGLKMEVMRASVEKVEGAVYGVIVRGRERPRGWVPEVSEGRREEVEGY